MLFFLVFLLGVYEEVGLSRDFETRDELVHGIMETAACVQNSHEGIQKDKTGSVVKQARFYVDIMPFSTANSINR
jgi:hypothetical protein